MTTPRQILPNSTYLITRRCTQREFLLTPSSQTNANVEYCLALAAQHTGVVLHAVCVMSNHWHGVLTDPHARLPEFLERFHRLLAKAQNALLKRAENLWASEKTSVVLLASYDAVLEKMAYTIANPTSAGLVDVPHDWPGVLGHCDLNAQRSINMPGVFFDEHGELPQTVHLDLVRPPIYPELSDAQFAQALGEAVAKFVQRARDRFGEVSEFVGARKILAQSPTTTPAAAAPIGELNPRVATKSRAPRIRAIARIVEFVRAYRETWLRWRDGARDAIFPAGTYALRVHYGATCAPP